MKYHVQFFQPKEFTCPCCGRGQAAVLLVLFLDMLRRAWDAPILVNSGYRCAQHNKDVKGAANSRHLLGLAADIRPKDPELIGPFQYLVQRATWKLDGWEVINYPTFVHVAVPRGAEKRLWNGGVITLEAA